MCGITGFVDFTHHSRKDELILMQHTLNRRGPDGQGQTFLQNEFAQIGLAHNRLSILDLSIAGHQPYQFEHLHLSYNGEVYNFHEIKKQLEEKGYTFESQTDTEVIIKAFHCWGVNSVQKFRGMFAFCLYDAKLKKLYLFRDRVGVKPLYYYHQPKLLLFASTLAPLLKHPRFEKQLNLESVSEYMQFGYISAPNAIFKNTFKLKPGHFLELNLVNQILNEHCYWSISASTQEPLNPISEPEAIQTLDAILKEALQLRMIADVPVGCFLSGGIDSSLVTAILQKQQNQPLHTFTIGFENARYNEAEHAKKIAQYLGTHHTEYYCSEQDAQAIIPELPKIYDEPFADASAIPTYLVAKIAKQHVKVALSSDGGDEIFGGYSVYEQFPSLFKTIAHLPARRYLAKIAQLIPDPILFLDKLNPKYYKKYLKLKTLLSTEPKLFYRITNAGATPCELKKLLGFYASLKPLVLFSDDIRTSMRLTDFETYLPDDILTKVDRASMYASLEGREPLLDHKIIEYAQSLPASFKRQKYILKKVLAQYLPSTLFERKKQGFGLPINDWLQNDLQFFIHEYLDESKIKQQGLLNISYIKHLKQKLLTDKATDSQIWTILMFQMWHEHYL